MKRNFLNYCGLFGILSFLSYSAAVIFSPLAYPGYDWMRQAVSDLSAVNAPSLSLWNKLSSVYNVCEVLCCVCVCISFSSLKSKTLKIGIYLFALMELISQIGYKMFPLSDSGFSGSFQDIMHMVVTMVVVMLSIASLILIIIGGFKTKGFKCYSICAIICLSMMMIGALGVKIVPANYFGIVERFSVIAVTLFNMLLGIFLFLGYPLKKHQTCSV